MRTPVLAALLLAALLASPAAAADKAKAAAQPSQSAQAGQPTQAGQADKKQQTVEVSGRVTAGLDQVFIKDPAQGYFLVRGADLTPYSGRMVQATGVVTASGAEYKTLAIKSFRIQNPDDEAPGAAGAGREDSAKPSAKKKK